MAAASVTSFVGLISTQPASSCYKAQPRMHSCWSVNRESQWRAVRNVPEDSNGNGRIVRMRAEGGLAKVVDEWEEPISLGTATLPENVNLAKLEDLLFQWGNSLTQNANLPLTFPLKVDKVEGGVRLGYVKLTDGAVENLVHIDVTVSPGVGSGKPTFQASRGGKYKTRVPVGEPMIMQSLLRALQKSIEIAKGT